MFISSYNSISKSLNIFLTAFKLAQEGKKILLIDLNVKEKNISKYIEKNAELRSNAKTRSLFNYLNKVELNEKLDVLVYDIEENNELNLFEKFVDNLNEVESKYDLILIDTESYLNNENILLLCDNSIKKIEFLKFNSKK